ncbi:MAG: ATP-binding protein, partial [Candidatus Competibacter sp.]
LESERFKQAVLDAVTAHVAVLDREGRIVAVNESWRRFALENAGAADWLAASTGIGASYLTICREAYGESAEGAMAAHDGIAAVLEGRANTFSLDYPCHLPQVKRWFTLTATPLGAERGGAVVSHVDITPVRQLAEQLRDERDRFAKIAATVPGVIYSFRQRPDGSACFPYASPAIDDLFGASFEVLAESVAPLRARVHPDDLGHLDAGIAASAQAMSPWRDEFRMRHPTRGEIWLEGHSMPVREPDGGILWHGYVQDITARKRAEQELQKAYELQTALLDKAPALVWRAGIDAKCEWFNATWLAFTGRSMEQERGDGWAEGVHPDDFQGCLDCYIQSFHARRPFEMEYRLRHHDGAYRWIVDYGIPLHSSAGEFNGYIGYCFDITERKAAETALRTARRLAEAASAAKGEFLAHMSHEIRTPLNGVLGLAQVLNREALTANQHILVERIQDAGQSLLAILNDILDFSKIEAGQLRVESRPFTLNGLLAQVSNLLGQTALAKGLELRITPPTAPVGPLLGDRLRLEQVLANLIGNAIKFTEQGAVTLTVQVREASVTTVWLRFEVRDTGIGIPPEALQHLFAPFTQAEAGITRRFGGTGLGLAICKRLVDLMGGAIGAESQVGQGSRFWFELPFPPAAEGETEAPAEPAPVIPSAGPRLSGARVLVVDDSAINRDVVERALKLEGATITLAGDGQQAIQHLRARPDAFDAVLMDVRMPVLDGLAATRIIRSELGLTELPVLALTAGVLAEQQAAARAAGVNDVLAKPLDLEQLTATLLRWVKPRPERAATPPAPRPAPLAGSEPADEFPDIAGIDRARTIQTLGNNRALFLRLLDGLIAEFADVVARTRRDLARGEREAVSRCLHTLRGNAGNLGALTVMRAAGDLEEALRAGQTDLEVGLVTLGRYMDDLIVASAPWRRPAGATVSVGSAQPAEAPRPFDATALQPKVQALAAMLDTGQVRARKVSAEIEALLAGTELQPLYAPIARAIARLDFKTALENLRALTRQHDWNWL